MAHVSLITLGVDDLDRATAFYTALGWRRSCRSVDGVVTFLQGGTVVLGLYGREALAEDAGLPTVPPPGPGPIALAVNLASEEEVDDLVAAAVAAGGEVTEPPTRTDWGGYSGYVVDPDGHLWEIAHNPGFPLGRDGRVMLPD